LRQPSAKFVESELFGHERCLHRRVERKLGRFNLRQRTIVLDEVAPFRLAPGKLLRVLQSGPSNASAEPRLCASKRVSSPLPMWICLPPSRPQLPEIFFFSP